MAFPGLLMKCWTPKTLNISPINHASKCSPWCLMHGANFCSTCVHSQIHLYYMCNIYSQRVQPVDHISQAFELLTPKTPKKMPPWGIVGRIVFSLCQFPDESTEVFRIWCQSVHPFGSFPRLNLWPLKPPLNAPCAIEGRIVFSYIHSQTNP